jgi:ABC-2 type transport system permease protein
MSASSASVSMLGSLARGQYAAVLRMRWRMQLNALRTRQGKFELGARIFATGFFAVLWLGAGIGCGIIAYQLALNHQLRFLPALLWPLCFLWQVVPVMLSAAQESVEFNFLLRFPVGFRSYALLYLFFGIFDPASMLGGICVLGVWIGTVAATPALAPWITLALALFALFNFLLTRAVFAWIERWLAQRRTREILGLVSFFVFLGFQLFNPALHERHGGRHQSWLKGPALVRAVKVVESVQVAFPPGLAAAAVEKADKGAFGLSLALLGGVAVYAASVGGLLGLRLRGDFRGENFGEAPVAAKAAGRKTRAGLPRDSADSDHRRRGLLDGTVGAVLAKELQCLARSGVMLFGLFAPLVFIFVMGGPVRGEQSPAFPYAFPLAVAYGFLPLTRQFCNSLGTEGAGIQLYFLSPTPFRSVMLAKNLLQTGLLCLELALVAALAAFRFGPPGTVLAVGTFCWVLFALPANLAAGNILSITLAYRMSLARLSREQGSVGNGLLSLVIQLLIFGVGVGVYLPLALVDRAELAGPLLLLLAALSVWAWLRGLANVDGMANRRREALLSTLVRPM